jgi:hypothetical protein
MCDNAAFTAFVIAESARPASLDRRSGRNFGLTQSRFSAMMTAVEHFSGADEIQ